MKSDFSSTIVALSSWEKWVAQDADGTGWTYEIEPLKFHNGWYENEVGQHQRTKQQDAPLHWKNTLKKL